MSSAGMLLCYPGSAYVQGMLGVGRMFRRDFWDKIPLSFLSLLLSWDRRGYVHSFETSRSSTDSCSAPQCSVQLSDL